jgi:hypothetical protein
MTQVLEKRLREPEETINNDFKHNVQIGQDDQEDIFSDIRYICNSTSLIVESLQRGLDVAQLPSGDLIVTEVKTVNTHYSWDKNKLRMVKIGQS